ncbi:LPO_1073/Vpar_1526 family protein [Pseudolactococcus hodotermopsidis]|uniref:LPO_1073/Vpar_1526 family protein n=1 Tax=Pseudolactococcus hodotermopsidis TaxID=2709157 RepID=UPI001553848A|nr:LPO_1073/Vpar_1526 family protein [Lactococcus hodotermopsidis]
MVKKQQQRAGDSSQQFQAEQMNFVMGIDEKRAREIIDEKLEETIKKYSLESQEIAKKRIQLFANELIPKLVKNSLLDELKEPSIQMLILDAQKTAASTERLADCSLLSELLTHRIKNGTDRNIRSSVSQAVKIVGEISEEALLGLTVVYAVSALLPSLALLYQFRLDISAFNAFFTNVLNGKKLPNGNEWIDNLEILGAVRISPPFFGTNKFNQVIFEQLDGYVDVGILKESKEFNSAKKMLLNAGIPECILVDHELRDGYVRLNLVTKKHLRSPSFQVYNEKQEIQYLTEEQITILEKIYDFYENNDDYKNENIAKFIGDWDSYNSLKQVREWWDNHSVVFYNTAVGDILAHTNTQRCEPSLPSRDSLFFTTVVS